VSKVVFDMSMSLDGYVRAPNNTPEEPLGVGGEQLHDWGLDGSDSTGRELLDRAASDLGATICGRRTYDDSLPFWGANGPTGDRRLPLFVLTHDVPSDVPEGGVYTFVTDGPESALRQARAVAGEGTVSVMGPDVGRQFIEAGLVDEISVHLVPILFGGGLRMFDHLGDGYVNLEVVEVVESKAATHLRYRVVRK
jgi:dihydrofolate reductase